MDVQTKIIATLAGTLGGWLGTKALAATWKAVTGNATPDDPEDPDLGIVEALAFAALSGAFIGIARVLATRGASKAVAKRSSRRALTQ